MPPFSSDSQWMVAEGKVDGKSAYYAVIEKIPDGLKAHWTNLVIVRWAYDTAPSSDFPSDASWQQIEAFEKRVISPAYNDRSWTLCAAIMTASGVREWRFYARDLTAFKVGLNHALSDLDPLPLEIEVFDDPAWFGFSELREKIDDQR